MTRKLLAAALVLALAAVAVACTPTDGGALSCLSNSGPHYVVPSSTSLAHWPSSKLVLANGTTIDASKATFNDTQLDSSGYGIGIKFHYVESTGTRDRLCLVGGKVLSSIEPENTPWLTWHRVTGMTVLPPNISIIGTSFYNQGDMISFAGTAKNWKVIGVRAEGKTPGSSGYIHDDCIENDSMQAGLVDDSKLDGCMVFMSSIDEGTNPAKGGTNTVEIRNSLVRLRPYHNSYSTPKYGYDKHGGFFKWAGNPTTEGVAPKLYVHDSTFRSDDRAVYGGNVNGFLGLPPGTRCDRVTLIGTEKWPAGDLASWKNQCTHLTLATAATWDAQVAAWNSTH